MWFSNVDIQNHFPAIRQLKILSWIWQQCHLHSYVVGPRWCVLIYSSIHSTPPPPGPLRSENSDRLLSQQIPMLLPPASSTSPPLNPAPPPPSYRLNRGWGGKGIGGHWTATAGQSGIAARREWAGPVRGMLLAGAKGHGETGHKMGSSYWLHAGRETDRSRECFKS